MSAVQNTAARVRALARGLLISLAVVPALASALAFVPCAAALGAAPAQAGERLSSQPLYVRNLSPVSSLFALPAQASAARGTEGWSWAVHATQASHYVSDTRGEETLLLDGETGSLTVQARYSPAPGWNVELEIPWLRQSGGFMDSAIDGWHELWGMPDNGRGDAPRDRLSYRYGEPQLRFGQHSDSAGLADVSLSLQHSVYQNETLAFALAGGYSFGSGEARKFRGSGEAGAWLALRMSGFATQRWPLNWHAQLGYLHSEGIAMLGSRQERELWFAGLSLEWPMIPGLSLLGQVDSHAAPLDSELDALGSVAVLLSAGLRWQIQRDWALDLMIVEDIAVETAPDVSFQASLRYRL